MSEIYSTDHPSLMFHGYRGEQDITFPTRLVGILTVMVVSGDWQGYYFDPDNKVLGDGSGRFPISAILDCHGNRLLGSMIDSLPNKTVTFAKLVESWRDDVTSEQLAKLEAHRDQHPDLCYRSELPAESTLLGTVKLPRVHFVKSYAGRQYAAWEMERGAKVVYSAVNSRVHYLGTVDKEGNVIEGTWTIRRNLYGVFTRPRRHGTFRLERIGK